MVDRKILAKCGPNNQNLALKASQETLIVFAASLIWQMLDSYYITALFTLSMVKNKQVESASISKRI